MAAEPFYELAVDPGELAVFVYYGRSGPITATFLPPGENSGNHVHWSGGLTSFFVVSEELAPAKQRVVMTVMRASIHLAERGLWAVGFICGSFYSGRLRK